MKKSSPTDRPKKQARLAALHAIGRMRLTILHPPNRVLELCSGTFSSTSLLRAASRLVSTLLFLCDDNSRQASRKSRRGTHECARHIWTRYVSVFPNDYGRLRGAGVTASHLASPVCR